MYSAAVYNYFNNSSYTRKTKYCKRRIPIPKPVKTKQMNTCITCGRRFLRAPPKNEVDTAIVKQPGNIVYEKVLLIWKYAKSFLSKTVRRQDPQKCSFKIIAHKSYKKRSLHKEFLTTSASVLQQLYCPICEQQGKIEKNKCFHIDEPKTNDKVLQETKPKSKKKEKRKVRKSRKEISVKGSLSLTETSDTTQTHEYLRGKKRHIRLCTRSSRSSFQKKRPKYNGGGKVKSLRTVNKTPLKKKTDKKKIGPKKTLAPKRKLNTNKNKKQTYFRESRKKINRFASWQYIQHALNSVTDDNPSSQTNEDKSPVYLTFEEYCLILEAIDTPGNTAERLRNTDEDSSTNVENPPETEENTGSTSRIENVGTNTEAAVANTEDASTNTDILWEIEVATNTEQIIDNTEELTNKTVLASISELNEETEELNEELNENSERLSETTETLDAVNDLITEAIEDFEANMSEPSDSTINIEINKANDETGTNSSKGEKPSQDNSQAPNTNEQPPENNVTNQSSYVDSNNALRRNVVPNNSFVDINEINQSHSIIDPNRLCEEIGKLEKSDGTEQTQSK